MIIGSALLLLVAIALFGAGTYSDSGPLYYSSIVTSVLAASALVTGLRQARVRLALDDDFDCGGVGAPTPARAPHAAVGATPEPPVVPVAPVDSPSADPRPVGPRLGALPLVAPVPVDEPAEGVLGPAERAALIESGAPVAVVDGRPRFHHLDCLHLLGRRVDHLPVAEAIEARFSACAHCWPGPRTDP